MNNTLLNRAATKTIAKALAELNERAVFVGGAVVSLYIDDPSAEDVRPTKDIDISLEIASVGELEAIRENLNAKGFYQTAEDDVICRFRYKDIKVDVMSTKEVGWAPASPWFEPGFKDLRTAELDDIKIRLLPLPYFLAAKFAAFKDRSGDDPRTSQDFEDIVYLLNYSSKLKDEIMESENLVQQYLKRNFQEILESDLLKEAINANLYHENIEVRYKKIITKLEEIKNGL